nr:hypothetical protein Iba_chr03eCG5680 [Ipomoea batatas]
MFEPMKSTVFASQPILLTTKYTPAMKAADIMASETHSNGSASLKATCIELMSPSWAHIIVTATIMALYIAMESQIMNSWNFTFCSIVAMPRFGLELLEPPGIVNPAVNVTVTTSVATSRITLTRSLEKPLLVSMITKFMASVHATSSELPVLAAMWRGISPLTFFSATKNGSSGSMVFSISLLSSSDNLGYLGSDIIFWDEWPNLGGKQNQNLVSMAAVLLKCVAVIMTA